MPVLIQANAEFFLEKNTTSLALRMLKKEGIHLLGSDCHDLSSRKPNLQGALELINRRLGRNAMEGILSCQRNVLAED
jgi:protein-tyrosine phosphatase